MMFSSVTESADDADSVAAARKKQHTKAIDCNFIVELIVEEDLPHEVGVTDDVIFMWNKE